MSHLKRVLFVFVFQSLIKCEVANWINLAENRDEMWVFCEHLMNFSKTVRKFLTQWATICYSRRAVLYIG